jgi:predicted nucleotidyltransferase component of viral defense system
MTVSSQASSSLTQLQRDLLQAFFRRERRLFLTGGAALAGFYFGHRQTDDLDLFAAPGLDLREAASAMSEAAAEVGAVIESLQTYPDFRRLLAQRGNERCVVDLVVDRAVMVESEKARFGEVRVDTIREIAANKICTLVSRSEIKDLVDLRVLLEAGTDLRQAFADAQLKERGADPATVAWLLEQLSISPKARLPGGVDPALLDEFRKALIQRLRSEAFSRVSHS